MMQRSVVVPVMEVRYMRMGVRLGLMSMRMGMARRCRQPGMAMVVMSVVMAVAMRVEHRGMSMLMRVPCGQHEIETSQHEPGSHGLDELDRLLEQRPGQDHPNERRGRKEEL